jgi:nitrate reductase NapE
MKCAAPIIPVKSRQRFALRAALAARRGRKAMASSETDRRKDEVRAFLFLTVFLAPIVSVALVGGLGLSIWIYQMFAGPPGS